MTNYFTRLKLAAEKNIFRQKEYSKNRLVLFDFYRIFKIISLSCHDEYIYQLLTYLDSGDRIYLLYSIFRPSYTKVTIYLINLLE